jgi:Flp pilus assembly protein TadD
MNTQQDVIAALRKGEVDTAMDRARLLTEAAPDDSTSYRLLAVAQAAVGDLASAHSSLDRALQLAPDDATLHYQRATFFVGERRSDATREVLGRAVEIDPNEIRVYLLRAQLALWDRDIEQAESELRFAERLDSGHPVALTLRGVCLLWRRHLDDAVELLSRAVRIAPENPQARYALGLAYLAKSHFAFAEQAFRSILEQLPGLHAARRLLADALRQQGRLAEAADILVAGPRVEVPVDMLRHAAGLWSEAGEPGKALDVLKRAASIAPRDGRVLDALIAALRLRGDAAHAREVVETALLSAPEIDGLWSARLSFEPTGGDLKAIADRWLAAIPGSIPALHLQMWLAERDGRLDDAVKLADRILAADQTHFEANVVRIRDLFLQDPNAAVAHLDHLLTQVSDERTRRMVLGWRGRALDRRVGGRMPWPTGVPCSPCMDPGQSSSPNSASAEASPRPASPAVARRLKARSSSTVLPAREWSG